MTVIDRNLTRAAILQPSTWNAEARTLEAVASTFVSITRQDAKGRYREEIPPEGLDLSTLDGAPVLDGHRSDSGRDVIGSVIGHEIEDGKLIVKIKVSGAADAAPIVERLVEGTLRSLSIGYRVTRWAETVDPVTKERIRRAVAWSISEVSVVPIPADRGATIRSKTNEVDIVPTEVEERAETRKEIRAIARAANLPADWADSHIDADATVTEVRAAAFEEMQKRGKALPVIKTAKANDDPAQVQTRAADALAFRMVGASCLMPAANLSA